MNQSQLDEVFRNGDGCPIPDGDSYGTVLIAPNRKGVIARQQIVSIFWQGKDVNRKEKSLINRVFGRQMVKAEVFHGESLFDGKQAVFIGYKNTAPLFAPISDEIRLVAPGIYLGRVYIQSKLLGDFFACNFILDFNENPSLIPWEKKRAKFAFTRHR